MSHDAVTAPLLTEAALLRRVIYDVSPCEVAQRNAVTAGLAGVSPDVDQAEHSTSHDRLECIGHIAEQVDAMGQACTQAFTAVVHNHVTVHAAPEVEAAVRAAAVALFEHFITPALQTSIANLVEMGYLTPTMEDL